MTRAEESSLKAYPKENDWLFPGSCVDNIARRTGYQQGYRQAKKDTIDRAVKWLCTHHTFDTEEQAQFYAAAFKKAMEKEEQ